jgi:hypothetical protein
MITPENLQETIADYGIDIALECCANLIRNGYLDATHTQYDRRYLVRFLDNVRTKVTLFEIQELIPEEP